MDLRGLGGGGGGGGEWWRIVGRLPPPRPFQPLLQRRELALPA